MHQAHVFISGIVQGVGYRYFVKANAEDLGLTGWVRNTVDGRVEAVFQGKKQHIEKIMQLCKKGPFLAEIRNIEVEWEEIAERFVEFTIR